MRRFTDAEKQLLQAKIEDEQERHNQAVEELSRRKEGIMPKNHRVLLQLFNRIEMSRTTSALGSVWKYGFLGVILSVLVFNVTIVLIWRNVSPDQVAQVMYANVVLMLALLFHHIAFYITNRGWASRVMKTIAVIGTVLAAAYVYWVF